MLTPATLIESTPDSEHAEMSLAAMISETVGSLHTVRAAGPLAWLSSASERVAGLFAPGLSCWAAEAGADVAASRWRIGHFGTAGLDPSVRSALEALFSDGLPIEAEECVSALVAGVSAAGFRLDSYEPHASWQRSAYRMYCERTGVCDFMRCFRRLLEASQPRWIIVEVQSDSPSRRVDDAALQLLGVVTGAIASAYDHRFLRLERARAALTARVSAAARPVLPLLAEGLSETEIGKRVYRSVHTVHDHVKQIYRSLGISSRIELRDLWMGYEPDDQGA